MVYCLFHFELRCTKRRGKFSPFSSGDLEIHVCFLYKCYFLGLVYQTTVDVSTNFQCLHVLTVSTGYSLVSSQGLLSDSRINMFTLNKSVCKFLTPDHNSVK